MSIETSDLDLLKSIREGDVKAFEVLFDKYWSKIFTTAFNRLRDREACIEITNDIFITLWEKRDRLTIHSISGYMHASTRYHVYRHIKKLRSAPIDHVDLEFLSTKPQIDNCDYNLRYKELESFVDSKLNQLPGRCKEVYQLSRKEHLTNDEIAIRLNISKRTVENQITHALKHLRLSLKDMIYMMIWMVFFF